MSEHCGYVVKVENLRPHSNADRLQIATFFGNDTCVGLDIVQGEIGIYFPSDLQLSIEFCDENHMCRKRADGTDDTGYLDRDKRNIRPIKLRGEKSDGIFVPLSAVVYTGVNLDELNIGDKIEMLNGHEICCKYIPHTNRRSSNVGGNKTRKKKVNIAPLFTEHADTEQLAYNLFAFKPGDEIEITLKMHGTSQRTGYLPILKKGMYEYTSVIKGIIHRLIPIKSLRHAFGEKFGKPHYDWGYVSGTRRTVLDNYDGGYYGSNEFREQHSKTFEGKLWKGETVYYEVVGFTHTGAPIMAEGNNEKLGKDFVKQYGKETIFSYGCSSNGYEIRLDGATAGLPQSDIYVYRMTMTNEDGAVVEYSPDFMRYRCEQMGVKCVPVFTKGYITDNYIISTTYENGAKEYYHESLGEAIKALAEQYYDGPDPIGKTHIREGVVVRIVNRPKFTAFKHKNYSFKMLEGIIKDTAIAPDIEEAQEL